MYDRYSYNPETSDPVKDFETEYPDIHAPIAKMLSDRDKTRDAQTAEIHARIFEEAMDVARPDWRDLRDNPEFHQWMQANPDQQKAAQVPGVRAALQVLEAFDRAMGRKPSPRSAAWLATTEGYAAEDAPASFKGRPGAAVPSLDDALDGFAATD